jgi:quercetin dioxygenase-like cupin family protein
MVGKMKNTPRGEFTYPKREVFVYFGSDENDTFGAGVCRIPPGSNNERHCHPEGDEVIYVIEGLMHIEVEGTEFELEKGDAILLKKGQMHQIFNRQPDKDLLHTFTFNRPAQGDLIRSGYGRSDADFKIYPPEFVND